MKSLIVLRGPCGAGKSYIKKKLFKDAIHINMYDAPRTCFNNRLKWLEAQLKKIPGDKIVTLEGIFAPHTASFIHLEKYCSDHNIALTSITIVRPLKTILKAIKEDTSRQEDIESRTDFAKMYHAKFV